jgi:phage I-like protein
LSQIGKRTLELEAARESVRDAIARAETAEKELSTQRQALSAQQIESVRQDALNGRGQFSDGARIALGDKKEKYFLARAAENLEDAIEYLQTLPALSVGAPMQSRGTDQPRSAVVLSARESRLARIMGVKPEHLAAVVVEEIDAQEEI